MNRLVSMILIASLYSASCARAFSDELPVVPAAQTTAQRLAALEEEANRLFWQRKFEDARKLVIETLNVPGLSRDAEARIRVNLAICEGQLDNLNAAKKEAL